MKQLEREYSPIRSKRAFRNLNEEYHIPGAADLTVVDTLNQHHFEQRLSTAAKTIVYLFSPQIDLLQHLQHNIEQYDKYKKTKLILRELMSNLTDSRQDIELEMLKTKESLEIIQVEIKHFKELVNKLEEECQEKQKIIEEQRSSLIKLTEAYGEAKIYWQDQITQLENQVFRLQKNYVPMIRINGEKSVQQSPRSHRTPSKSSRLKVPHQERKKQSSAYTDRSLYIRFSASNKSLDSKQSQRSSSQKKYRLGQNFKVEQLTFEKEALERKIAIIEEQYRILSQKHQDQETKCLERLLLMEKQLEEQKKVIQLSNQRLGEKNKMINELLLIIEGQQS